MIRQEAAGIYAWLPLGLRVLNKIEQIVREEMNRAGAIELLMPTLQLADLWRESGRYDAYGAEMLRITDRHERDLLYGPTNEEMITEIFRAYVKTLQGPAEEPLQHPVEVPRRAPAPLRRDARPRVPDEGRLFASTWTRRRRAGPTTACSWPTSTSIARLGLKAVPMRADTGPIGGDLSHEFIILADTGESEVFCAPRPGRDGRARARRGLGRRPAAAGGPAHGPLRRPPTRCTTQARLRRRGARGQADDRPRHRGRPHLLFRRRSTPSR